MSKIDEKIMIASDIHGSAHWCEKLVAACKREKPGKLLKYAFHLFQPFVSIWRSGHRMPLQFLKNILF